MIIQVYEAFIESESRTQSRSLGYHESPEKAYIAFLQEVDAINKERSINNLIRPHFRIRTIVTNVEENKSEDL